MLDLSKFEPLFYLAMVFGAVCLAAHGMFDTDIVAAIFGSDRLADVMYAVIGVAGLMHVPGAMARLNITK